MDISFERQTDTPLFPDMFWKRPTMKSRGGRMLLVGGQKNEFSQLQAIYQIAEAAGIGECQAAMPDSLRRTLGEATFGTYLPASNSGSLGKAALAELLHLAQEADGLVIGANLTNNSETGVMVESLLRELDQRVIITEDAIELLKFEPTLISGNPNALVITTMNGLFALANHHHMPIAIQPQSGVVGKMQILQQLVDISEAQYVVFDQEIMVATEGKISLTPLPWSLSQLPATVVGVLGTFWLQQPRQSFAALTTGAYIVRETLDRSEPTYSALSRAIMQVLREHDEA